MKKAPWGLSWVPSMMTPVMHAFKVLQGCFDEDGHKSALRPRSRRQPTVFLELWSLENRIMPAVGMAQGMLPDHVQPSALRFEQNAGQMDPQVDFVARADGYTGFFMDGAAAMRFFPASRGSAQTSEREDPRDAALRIQPVGAQGDPEVVGENRLTGRSHYLVGNNPHLRHTNIAHYGQIRYRNVYFGIDVVYYGTAQGQVEWDYLVKPGADPGQIKLDFQGADRLNTDASGNLVVSLAGSEVIVRAPVLYQEIEGDRQTVFGSYQLEGDTLVSFRVGTYDPMHELVIDPVLVYASYFGGSGPDFPGGRELGSALAVDGAGNTYVAGIAGSPDFPTTAGSFDTTLGANDNNIFVSKFGADGTLIYSTFLGGSSSFEWGFGIAADSSGHAYITGYTGSADFPTTPNAFQPTKRGGVDAFVAKLSADGSSLLFASFLGGNSYDEANALALDVAGNVYVAGHTTSVDFPTTPGAFQSASPPLGNAFVAKINATGTTCDYVTFLGGSAYDEAFSIAVADNGVAYVTGMTLSADFPTVNAQQPGWGGGVDAFLTIVNATGSSVTYSSYLGGTGEDISYAVALASDGVWLTGSTASNGMSTANAVQPVFGGGATDAFFAKFSLDGSTTFTLSYLGGSGNDVGSGLAVDDFNNPHFTGTTSSPNFPTASPLQPGLGGGTDAFLTKLNPAGTSLIVSSWFGGSNNDTGQAVAVDGEGFISITGTTLSSDMPIETPWQSSNHGNGDVFVAKILDTPQLRLIGASPNTGSNQGVVKLHFKGVNFPSGPVSVRLTRPGQPDISALSALIESSSAFTAIFDLTGAGLGQCAVVATFSDGQTVTLPGAFTVTDSHLPWGTAKPGSIAFAGDQDEWSFFGWAGHAVTVQVNPGTGGPFTPYLGYAEVRLVNASNQVLAVAQNTTSGALVTLTDISLPADGTYRVQVRAASGHATTTGNYAVTLWDVTPDIVPLNLNQQVTGNIEGPFSVDRWTFTALADQQVRLDVINTSTTGVVFSLVGPTGNLLFDGLPGDSPLVTLPTSGSYMLIAHGTGGQTGTYTFRLQETTVVDLPLGATYSGTLAGSGQAQLFRIVVPAATALSVSLDDSATANRNELYAQFGQAPTRAEYDYRSAGSAADQGLFIPGATPGVWYVLVYAESVPVASTFTLWATAADIRVTAVSPDHHGTSAPATLTLSGAGFDGTTAVQLVAGDTVYSATSVTVDSFTQATATFLLAEVPAGTYAVRVARSDGASDVLPNAFTVVAAGAPRLETHLVVPNFVGRHALATLYVSYANTGSVAMPAPLLVLQSGDPDGSDLPFLTLDASRLSEGFWTDAIPDGFHHAIQILASGNTPGLLQPGESFQIPVHFAGLRQPWDMADNAVEFELRIFTQDESTAIDWNSLKAGLRPPGVDLQAWDLVFSNLVSAVGSTWGDYVRMLGDNAAYLGHLGQKVIDVGWLWNFELQQANGLHPQRHLASVLDLAVPAPGLALEFRRVFSPSIAGRSAMGPLGRGWSASWYTFVETDSDDSVTVVGASGSRRRFQPDSRNENYFALAAGDHATLTKLPGDVYLLRETDGLQTAFRADGKLDYVAETNGNRITAGYTAGRLTSLTHSAGQTLTLAYNPAGLVQSITSADGRTVLYAYDEANQHLIAVQSYDSLTTRYTYGTGAGTVHALLSIEDPVGTHQHFEYDPQGRLARIFRDGGTESITFGYNTAGLITATDAAGGMTKYFFNHDGLLAKLEDPLGRPTYFTFDVDFNLVRITDATGAAQVLAYDDRGNLVQSTDSLGRSTQFVYGGPINRLTAMTDARGNTTQYGHDSFGNLLTTTYADGFLEQRVYDAIGNTTSFTNRRDQATSSTFNSAGQVTYQAFADGTHVSFTYDTRGNMLTAADASGTTTFAYDTGDRLTHVTYPTSRFLSYLYDSAGRRVRMVDQDGFTVNYAYDAAGRLSGLTDGSGAVIVTYSYDLAGRLSRKDMGNGTSTTFAYDAAGQLLHLVNGTTAGTINSRFDYTFDVRGRRTRMATLDGQWAYTYDATGQLTHAEFVSTNPLIPHQDLTYLYDELGNRIATIENGVTTAYTTNNLNQYTAVGDATLTYDADGNLIAQTGGGENITYGYDTQNRLTSVVTPAGTWTYEYNAFGQRVAVVHNGQRTEYLLDPTGLGNVVGEYSGAGAAIKYVHGSGLVSRTDALGATGYYDFDVLGSTVGVSNSSGSYQNWYSYLPFGSHLTSNESVANSFGFVGQFGVMQDTNHLGYMRARYYSSEIGRFTAQDPIGIAGGLNLYAYVQNNPINFTDVQGTLGPGGFGTTVGDPHAGAGFPPGGGEPWTGGGAMDFRTNTGSPFTTSMPFHFDGDGGQGGAYGGSGVSGSGDPNQLIGPAGFGIANYVHAVSLLPYRIDFENEPAATAPAQQVIITNQLDSRLDWATFQLTEIGFGDRLITFSTPSQHYQTTVELTVNGRPIQVLIEAGLHSDTGQVYARFQTLDPETSLPPDVLTGFLPPEDGTGRGLGHISYVIKARPGLASGTEIRNVALIRFDGGEIVATNQIDPHDPSKGTDPAKEASITLDAGAPVGNVHVLSPITTALSFLVSWSGSDDVGGSGIAGYDVYVSDNGGAWSLWQDNTAAMSGTFTGLDLHTYAFKVRAVDGAGNRQADPGAAQATTQVVLPPVAMDDVYGITKGISLVTTTLSGLLVNDVKAPGRTLTAQLVTGPTKGTLTLAANGTFTYRPGATFDGLDSFTYRLRDNTGRLSNVATVTVATQIVNFRLVPVSINEVAGTYSLWVDLRVMPTVTTTVEYAVNGLTGLPGVDFNLVNGTLTFNPGQKSRAITFSLLHDTLDEVNETFQVNLSNPSHGVLGTRRTNTVTLTDNDAPPVVQFRLASSSGAEGTTPANLEVFLSSASAKTITINYKALAGLLGGTAVNNVDFTLVNGTLTFNPGETSKLLPLALLNDLLDEKNETVKVQLSAPTNTTLGLKAVHTFTILDNDATPTVSFTAATSSFSEAAGTITLTLTLSAASALNITVSFAVTGGTATKGGVDYGFVTPPPLTFTAGQTSKTIKVRLINDTRDEPDEIAQISLASPVNALLSPLAAHLLTILDND